MKTGFQGTFVIAWAQTAVDGEPCAPMAALRPGAVWCWAGEAVRVDGPADVMPLGLALGEAQRHDRAGRALRKWLLPTPHSVAAVLPDAQEPMDMPGFTVTDGQHIWPVALIGAGPGGAALAMFAGDLPPRKTDLWVVARRDPRPLRTAEPAGGVICFTAGTLLRTAKGPRPVETLAEGDLVLTKDDGPCAVLWIGHRRLSGARLQAMPHLRPIRVQAGALDRGIPDATLLVSPDHRLLLRGPRAQSLFNCAEVLVAARDLRNDQTVVTAYGLREVTYYHLLLPSHQIVWANGIETESFDPASAALASMDPAQLARLQVLLPAVTSDPQSYGAPARRVLSLGEAAIFRHDGGIGQVPKRVAH